MDPDVRFPYAPRRCGLPGPLRRFFGVARRRGSLHGLSGLVEMARRDLHLLFVPVPKTVENCRSAAMRRMPEMGLGNQRNLVCQVADTADGLVRSGLANDHVKDRCVRVGAPMLAAMKKCPLAAMGPWPPAGSAAAVRGHPRRGCRAGTYPEKALRARKRIALTEYVDGEAGRYG